jgi:hypothetical protein
MVNKPSLLAGLRQKTLKRGAAATYTREIHESYAQALLNESIYRDYIALSFASPLFSSREFVLWAENSRR